MAIKRGMKVLDLKSGKASWKIFVSYLKSADPDLIFLNGHGSAHEIGGQNNEVLVSEKTDVKLLKGKIMYVRSCESGAYLGKFLVKNGLKAFVGYADSFYFPTLIEYKSRPLLDPLTRVFLEPSNLVVTTLIKGHSVLEAHLRSQNSMIQNFKRMVLSSSSSRERVFATYLWSNLQSQVVWGSKDARV